MEKKPALHPLLAERLAVLATMHRKEQVIAPLLEEELGLRLSTPPPPFDTDSFGTFTREVSRPAGQLETARRKALHAMQLTGARIGLASEGSFGPHPASPFLAANRELVVLIDAEHDLEVVGQVLTTRTNFAARTVRSLAEALAFAREAGFPEHGLVVIGTAIVKGITEEALLVETLKTALAAQVQVRLETDMRALYNPTRMTAIGDATRDLIEKLKSFCPRCAFPGWGPVDAMTGLPCSLCGSPTELLLVQIWRCRRCALEERKPRPDGLLAADPAQCPYCNP